MNKKILETLEFSKVKTLFEPHLLTEQGLGQLRELAPTGKVDKIKQAFAEMEEMQALFVEQPHFTIQATKEIAGVCKRLEMGADLNIEEFLLLKRVLLSSRELQSFYDDLENVSLQELAVWFEKLHDFPHLQGNLQAFNDAGFIENFASEELARIRRKIHDSESQVRDVLQDLLKQKVQMLTEGIVASRNGRQVLPVKNTYRNKIAGVVHDISASGNTVYIEPREVVKLSEEIASLRADERYEMLRILQEISERVRPHAAEIANDAWIIGHLDLIRAKVRFIQEMQAVVPKLSEQEEIQLLQVRHPLVKNAVANDVHFGQDLTAIVITGPNTGGKTIMLKTLGLTQVMAQSGLPILADKGSRVAVFDQIFADIGDEQSIEQSLSTFSSHMTNIVQILGQVNQNSLLLLDELGAGTDPQEGAALAMAILEDLRLRQVKTMATTHYPELKAYGIETAFVQNASM